MSLNRCDVKIDGEGTAANPLLANRLLLLIRPRHLHQCGHGRCYTDPVKSVHVGDGRGRSGGGY